MNKQFWAVVPAAGTGQRFGGDLPKQYQLLAGQAILERTLANLLASNIFEGIVVALSDGDTHFDSLVSARDGRVLKAVGGASRAVSVDNALQALNGKAGPNDWVMVHDAARPLLSQQGLDSLVEAASTLKQGVGAILALPVAETLKLASNNDDSTEDDKRLSAVNKEAHKKIDRTVSREGFWAAQTPQMFAYNDLSTGLSRLINQGRESEITDEASAMELMSHEVYLLKGEASNIKITRPDDMRLAEAYLLSKESGQDCSKENSK